MSINPRIEYRPSLAHRNAKIMLNHNTKKERRNHGRTSLNTSFCDGVRLAGNRTLTRTTRSPRSAGFLDIVMPKPGNRSSWPGCVGPGFETRIDLPSIVRTIRSQPVRASLRLISTVVTRWSFWRLKLGCSFYRLVSTVRSSKVLS